MEKEHYKKIKFRANVGPEIFFEYVRCKMQRVSSFQTEHIETRMRVKGDCFPAGVKVALQDMNSAGWSVVAANVWENQWELADSTWEIVVDGIRYWVTIRSDFVVEDITIKVNNKIRNCTCDGPCFNIVEGLYRKQKEESLAKNTAQEKGIEYGYICVPNLQIRKDDLTSREAWCYQKLLLQKAPYFLVVQKLDEKYVAVVPLYRDVHKKNIAVRTSAKEYYANCEAFFRVPTDWLLTSHQTVKEGSLKAAHQNFLQSKAKWEKEKRRSKSRREHQLQNWERGVQKPKPKPSGKSEIPASISWNMNHPLQGGRVSPK